MIHANIYKDSHWFSIGHLRSYVLMSSAETPVLCPVDSIESKRSVACLGFPMKEPANFNVRDLYCDTPRFLRSPPKDRTILSFLRQISDTENFYSYPDPLSIKAM